VARGAVTAGCGRAVEELLPQALHSVALMTLCLEVNLQLR
jgi:hypothetical protein